MESKAIMGLDEYTAVIMATFPALVAMAIDDLGGGGE